MKIWIEVATLMLLAGALFIASEASGTIFCEEVTATNCKACPAVSKILHDIYASGDYPFYYVSMITDRQSEAQERATYYNVLGYPTSFFDGGYNVIFGKQSSDNFENAIQTSLQRERPSLRLTETLFWIGNNTIEAHVSLTNIEQEPYEGMLKIYVVEPLSRWNNYDGEPYHFAFLGYALQETIVLDSAESLQRTVVWNASQHGYTITRDNIMTIAVVFKEQGVIRYSDPPENTQLFTAHYVDACMAQEPAPDSPPVLKLIENPIAVQGYQNSTFVWIGTDDFGGVRFSYKLEPVDIDWQPWGYESSVVYPYLDDGSYLFRLIGMDNTGQISELSWSFIVDTSPPRVVSHIPLSNSRNVPVYAPINIVFSRTMNKTSVERGITVNPQFTFTTEWINDTELLVYPQALLYETTYTVTIRNAQRTSGQSLSFYSFSFDTTAADTLAPFITSAQPYNAEMETNIIYITYSEPMDTLLHRALVIEPLIAYTITWEANDTILSISLDTLTLGTYTITVTDNINDKNGNFMTANYSFNVYVTAPSVVSTNIENNEKNVDVQPMLRIRFSHQMNKTSVENHFSIQPLCSYNLVWEDAQQLFIYPELHYGETYHILISEQACDTRNLSLDRQFSLIFFTLDIPYQNGGDNGKGIPSFTAVIAVAGLFIVAFAIKQKNYRKKLR